MVVGTLALIYFIFKGGYKAITGFEGATYRFEYGYDYIGLPVKSGFSFGQKLKGIVNFGFVPSLLINAKLFVPEMGLPPKKGSFAQTIDIKEFTSEIDLAGLLELGLDITSLIE